MPTPTTSGAPRPIRHQAGRELGRTREDGQEDREAELGSPARGLSRAGSHLHSHVTKNTGTNRSATGLTRSSMGARGRSWPG